MGYGILGLIVFILDVVAIIDIIGSAQTTGMKALWIILVLILPVIGMALWFLMGSKKAMA